MVDDYIRKLKADQAAAEERRREFIAACDKYAAQAVRQINRYASKTGCFKAELEDRDDGKMIVLCEKMGKGWFGTSWPEYGFIHVNSDGASNFTLSVYEYGDSGEHLGRFSSVEDLIKRLAEKKLNWF